ncbi:MAG: GYD domain-containing protein [Candidatus Thorarchaeota archaeon]
MVVFIVLGSFTQEGITNLKDSPNRLEAAKRVAESVGGTIKEFYYTMGRYDFVAITEAPSYEAMMRALFTIGTTGAVRTESLQAIPIEKAVDIIKELP